MIGEPNTVVLRSRLIRRRRTKQIYSLHGPTSEMTILHLRSPADELIEFVSLLLCMSPLLARWRHADCVEQCPSSRAKRKTYVRTEFFSVSPATDITPGIASD